MLSGRRAAASKVTGLATKWQNGSYAMCSRKDDSIPDTCAQLNKIIEATDATCIALGAGAPVDSRDVQGVGNPISSGHPMGFGHRMRFGDVLGSCHAFHRVFVEQRRATRMVRRPVRCRQHTECGFRRRRPPLENRSSWAVSSLWLAVRLCWLARRCAS